MLKTHSQELVSDRGPGRGRGKTMGRRTEATWTQEFGWSQQGAGAVPTASPQFPLHEPPRGMLMASLLPRPTPKASVPSLSLPSSLSMVTSSLSSRANSSPPLDRQQSLYSCPPPHTLPFPSLQPVSERSSRLQAYPSRWHPAGVARAPGSQI